MELFDFQGLNCYSNCIVSAAHRLKVNWANAFVSMWSETDFRYDPVRKTYLSRRMIDDLARSGAQMRIYLCASPQDAEETFSHVEEGEVFLVGMDAFDLSWAPLYNLMHGPHYFLAQKRAEGEFPCFDPTYSLQGVSISQKIVLERAFDITRLRKIPPAPDDSCPKECVRRECRAALKSHPILMQAFGHRIEECAVRDGERAALAARYADALISNRYLFRYYLEKHRLIGALDLFSDKKFYAEWTAVKNGFYKVSVSAANEALLFELGERVESLLGRDMRAARKFSENV